MQLRFTDKSNDRKYFTILPNILWSEEFALSAHDLILYATIKKAAGEAGECFMSTRRLAQEAKMSTGQVSKSKQRLADAGLIEIITRRRGANGHPLHHITVTDIWQQNIEHFQHRSPGEQTQQTVHPVNTSVHPVNTSQANCSLHEQNCSPSETEEEPLKKNTAIGEEEEAEEETAATSASQIHQLLSDFGLQEPALTTLCNDNLDPGQIKGWILYLDTQDMPGKPGYLVNRLRAHQWPPADFLALAQLTEEQIAIIEDGVKMRRWRGDWYMSRDELAKAGIDNELAELWYQNYAAG